MSDPAEITCNTCTSPHRVRFCRNCTHLSCINCLYIRKRPIYTCSTCTTQVQTDTCGSCGSAAQIKEEVEEHICPVCQDDRLEDPEVLVANIASDYYAVINKVHEVNSELSDVYRSFDIMVALVRFCREAGLMGLPQMEMQLEKVSNALKKINKQSITSLHSIRQEGLYDIRTHRYFKEVELSHYRSLDGVLRTTEYKVDQHLNQIRFWITEVKHRIDQLKPTAMFLREHFNIWAEISPFLPSDISDVVAIIPPISMSVKTKRRKEQDDCYIIFTGEFCVFLPKTATLPGQKPVSGIKVPYADFLQRSRTSSVLKGVLLEIKLVSGSISMTAPPQVLDTVEKYFGLIDVDEPYMVGSSKKIVQIENTASDKNEYKRAATKLVTIFNEWLFEERVQQPEQTSKLEMPSVTELKMQLDRLEKLYSDINYKARHHQIPLDKYQDETSQIKDKYSSIKDTLARLSGHFGDIDSGSDHYPPKRHDEERDPFDIFGFSSA